METEVNFKQRKEHAVESKTCSSSPQILVPIDGSKPSEWAVNAAVRFAKQLGAQVTLMTVTPKCQEVVAGSIFYGSETTARNILFDEATKLLKKAEELVPETIRAKSILREGEPVDEIKTAANEIDALLIVMGSRGLGRFAQLVIGSVAQGVIRQSKCPVVTISHEPARTSRCVPTQSAEKCACA